MNILLSRILKYLNGTLFLDDAYRFCVFFILHYQDFDSYTIEDIAGELQTTPESILNFLKYLGFDNYLSFIEIYQRHKQVRFEQIQERMKNIHVSSYVERIKVSNDNEAFLKKIEEVCTKIHDSKRVILVGALYPMSIAVEFQTDMISFGKTVLQYHTYDKDMIFNENDYVIFISSSGRSLEGFMYTRTNLSLQNTTSLLVTQNPTYARKKLTTDTIQVPGRFDGINFNYQIMTIFDLIRVMYYQKYIEQEAKDKELLLKVLKQKDVLTRENEVGHFTVSCWVLNQNHNKVLMCYHKVYNSWSWLGGHVDGEKNFKKVALKEVQEESGLENVSFMSDDLFSLEVLTVDGHVKRGKYVSSHLHYNVTYLMEANDQDELKIKEDENKGLRWFSFEDALKASTEPWFVENIYSKLNSKVKDYLKR